MFTYEAEYEPPKNTRLDNGSVVRVLVYEVDGEKLYSEVKPNFYHVVFCYEDEEWIR